MLMHDIYCTNSAINNDRDLATHFSNLRALLTKQNHVDRPLLTEVITAIESLEAGNGMPDSLFAVSIKRSQAPFSFPISNQDDASAPAKSSIEVAVTDKSKTRLTPKGEKFRKYHRPQCIRLKGKHKIILIDIAEALEFGHEPCKLYRS